MDHTPNKIYSNVQQVAGNQAKHEGDECITRGNQPRGQSQHCIPHAYW